MAACSRGTWSGIRAHDLPRPSGAVEVARRLVGQHDLGRVDQGSRDGHPLVLAAAHLARPVIHLAPGHDGLRHAPGRRPAGLGGRPAKGHRQLDDSRRPTARRSELNDWKIIPTVFERKRAISRAPRGQRSRVAPTRSPPSWAGRARPSRLSNVLGGPDLPRLGPPPSHSRRSRPPRSAHSPGPSPFHLDRPGSHRHAIRSHRSPYHVRPSILNDHPTHHPDPRQGGLERLTGPRLAMPSRRWVRF